MENIKWICKCIFNISENKAGEYVKRNYTELYENESYKQKRGIYPQSDKLQKGQLVTRWFKSKMD